MTDIPAGMKSETVDMPGRSTGVALRSLVIGLIAFLTVVDLFATQAILPSLTRHYDVTPAAMGFAVNASTMGMAIAGLVVGLLSQHIDRRLGILLSLAILAVPTALLAVAPNLAVFTVLRVMQGLCMASAFALTLAYLGEQCSCDGCRRRVRRLYHRQRRQQFDRPAGIGRVRGHARPGVELLLLCGPQSCGRRSGVFHHPSRADRCMRRRWRNRPSRRCSRIWRNPALRAAFGIGFCILFAFIGTFTYVNFVLVRPPLSLGRMELGFVYFVFLPSVVTTLLAGTAVTRFGTRAAIWGALAVAAARSAAAAVVASAAPC